MRNTTPSMNAAEEAATATSSASGGETVLEADYRDWIALLKPRVMSLVVFSGAIGLLVAPGHLNPVLAYGLERFLADAAK